MEEDFDDEPMSLGPGGILSGVFIAVMGMAILYNAAFRQDPGHRAAGDMPDLTKKFIEISTGKPLKTTAAKPQGSSHLKTIGPNETVAAVQQELINLGLFGGPADGIEGELTVKAIEDYQHQNGLPESGHADQQVLDQIRYTRQLVAASGTTNSIAQLSQDGRIRMVQIGLSDLGYTPGAIDGFLGDATRQAIRQFQHDRGLPETGEISDDLIAELKDVSGVSHLN